MKNVIFLFSLVFLLSSCGGGDNNSTPSTNAKPKSMIPDAPKKDNKKGVGQTTSVAFNDPLNTEMISRGKSIYEIKCAACHKLSGQRVVGPGWAGITEKRDPVWIMNMITNVEQMLKEDPAAKALLKECLVRMPNQNLTTDDARDILEFMLSQDKS